MEAKNSDNSSYNGSSSGPSTVESQQYVSGDKSPDVEIPGPADRVTLEGNNTSYTNSSHWTSILDGVNLTTTGFAIELC